MIQKIKEFIIQYVYIISNQPVKLQELLVANRSYNEGLHLDGRWLGFRMKLGRAYLVFLLLVNFALLPFALIGHTIFQLADCHVSILVVIIVTGLIFASFNLFKDWLTDEVALMRIKMMWSLHFPLFEYKEYNKEINEIYIQSIVENIKKQDLEKYILDKIAE
jgi:hypothetical protein